MATMNHNSTSTTSHIPIRSSPLAKNKPITSPRKSGKSKGSTSSRPSRTSTACHSASSSRHGSSVAIGLKSPILTSTKQQRRSSQLDQIDNSNLTFFPIIPSFQNLESLTSDDHEAIGNDSGLDKKNQIKESNNYPPTSPIGSCYTCFSSFNNSFNFGPKTLDDDNNSSFGSLNNDVLHLDKIINDNGVIISIMCDTVVLIEDYISTGKNEPKVEENSVLQTEIPRININDINNENNQNIHSIDDDESRNNSIISTSTASSRTSQSSISSNSSIGSTSYNEIDSILTMNKLKQHMKMPQSQLQQNATSQTTINTLQYSTYKSCIICSRSLMEITCDDYFLNDIFFHKIVCQDCIPKYDDYVKVLEYSELIASYDENNEIKNKKVKKNLQKSLRRSSAIPLVATNYKDKSSPSSDTSSCSSRRSSISLLSTETISPLYRSTKSSSNIRQLITNSNNIIDNDDTQYTSLNNRQFPLFSNGLLSRLRTLEEKPSFKSLQQQFVSDKKKLSLFENLKGSLSVKFKW